MLLTNKPGEVLAYGLEIGQLPRTVGSLIAPKGAIAQPWLLYPLPPLNYNLTMTRDQQVLHDLFWKVPLASLLKDQTFSRLACNTAILSRSQEGLCHSVRDSNLTTTKWAGFLWPDLHGDQSISWSRLQNLSQDVIHDLYHPPQASAETWGVCFFFFDLFSGMWNRIFMSQHQALIYFISFPFPLATLFPPYSSSMSSQGSFLSKGELALFKGCHQKCLSLISPSKVL